MMRRNAMALLESSTAWAFRWCRNAFFCSYCDVKFIDIPLLRDHVKDFHLKDVPTKMIFAKITENNMLKVDVTDLKCRLCDQCLENIDNLKSHIVSVHAKIFNRNYSDGVLPFKLNNKNEYACQKCFNNFTSFSKLNEHMNTHYQNYVCDSCGKAFVSKSRFRTHVQSHEIGSFPCGECEQVLDTRVARMCHKFRVHRKGMRYACPRCPENFSTYYSRARHLVERHDQQTKEYPCNVCGRVFVTSCKRAAHVRSVHRPSERRYSCTLCSWSFVNKSQLRKHIVNHVPKQGLSLML